MQSQIITFVPKIRIQVSNPSDDPGLSVTNGAWNQQMLGYGSIFKWTTQAVSTLGPVIYDAWEPS